MTAHKANGKRTGETGVPGGYRKRRVWRILAIVILLSAVGFMIYVSQYYHADESADAALESDETVSVTKTKYGWFFDGLSDTDALIFYPGGKVEETAYAPLLHRLAGQGMDVCLVSMPFRLAVFGVNKADQVMLQHDYAHWYIGGHSLGGAMAAVYAAENSGRLTGLILLAAYPTKPLDESIRTIMIYGSEDHVLNMKKLNEGKQYLPDNSKEYIISGGNHAQFGNYGIQRGDGTADVSADVQQQKTVELIMEH